MSELPPLNNTPEELQACKDSAPINGRMPCFTSFNHGMENWLALACRERQMRDILTRLEKATELLKEAPPYLRGYDTRSSVELAEEVEMFLEGV